ncbi:SHOCT domain-containing protein [Kitasatospora sp. NBC_00458]|uniref:SHOCT domain-containing protein n=1 Tax=Kitasatospora sp. NBC_00458 TaxID=2903568 RepID=UPI002E1823CA
MDNYPLLNIFWTMLELFLWILWFFLLFKIITDIFRSHDIGGWAKAGWLILVILVPLIGVLIYVIARGKSMGERDVAQAKQSEAAFKSYIREAAADGTPAGEGPPGGRSHVDDLAKLAELKSSGAISDEEYRKAKEKILA